MLYNPYYLTARIIRKYIPETLAHKILSRRFDSVERLYSGVDNPSTSQCYLKAIVNSNAINLFQQPEQLQILEAGSGIYNPISSPLLLSGIKKLFLLEPFIGSAFDTDKFNTRLLEFLLIADKDKLFPFTKTRSVQDCVLQQEHIVNLSQHFWEDTKFEDAELDLILSASVFEHLRNPDAVIKESYRILKPGGFMINAVDMRDHFFKFPVEMLKYSDKAWKLLTTRRGGAGYLNRLRIGDWLRLLTRHGFSNTIITNLSIDDKQLKKEANYFDAKFKSHTLSELQTLHATIISEKL